jgi:hypothetical protein
MTIDTLPDDVLVEMFGFYANESGYTGARVSKMANYRILVTTSPGFATSLHPRPETPVWRMLDIWPPLATIIRQRQYGCSGRGVDNIIMALKHNDRVCQVTLWPVPSTHQKEVLAAMDAPFLELTYLN